MLILILAAAEDWITFTALPGHSPSRHYDMTYQNHLPIGMTTMADTPVLARRACAPAEDLAPIVSILCEHRKMESSLVERTF
jgi:hypothetical protein